ncbi:MAG: EAL domain-containing protein [Granulosicoccus sp.]|nr:EAL domain-containing protein [Granulosicoccus sp.]
MHIDENDESVRLKALRELDIMDTPPDPHLDAVVKTAALVCDVPISLITLLDEERQWFKANAGLSGTSQTTREVAFCHHTIAQNNLLEVNDALKDARFMNNPLVTGDPGIRFYAGAQLTLNDGSTVGSLCVIDRQPRTLTEKQKNILNHLAEITAQALQSNKTARQLSESEALFRALRAASPLGIFVTDSKGHCTYTNARWHSIFGIDEASAMGDGWTSTLHPDDKRRIASDWPRTGFLEQSLDCEIRIQRADGSLVYARLLTQPTLNAAGEVTGHVGSVDDITKQRVQEQALRESELLLKHTGALADVGGWAYEIATGELTWSEQSCRIHGVPVNYEPSLNDAIGFYTEEAQPVIRDTVQNAIDNGVGWDIELSMIRADGELIWVQSVGNVEYDNGSPVRLFGALQNVTHKVNQRHAIEAAHDRMALATESGSIGIWEWDIVQDELSWTPLMYELYGLRPSDTPLTYDTWRNSVHPDDLSAAETNLKKAIATGVDFDDQFRIVRPDGEVRHLRATARLARNASGAALRLVGVNWDVTPMRSLTSELAEQHELLHVTLRSIRDAVITTDASGNIAWLNPTAEEMTGWSVEDATSCHINQAFHILNSNTREIAPYPIEACLQQGHSVALGSNAVLLSRDGNEFGIEASAAPIRNEQGDILGAVLVFRDVTEQRRLSSEMTYRATHDSLTDLSNRAEFEYQVSIALKEAEATGTEHAVLFVDLDQFKLVNDACGHSVGDLLLQQVAKLLRACTREGDIVARLGGDEFGVLLKYCAIQPAESIAQELCNQMDVFRFAHEKRRFRIGTSIGLVPLDNRWHDVSDIMQAADIACYAAKDAGRNRVHIWYDTDKNISTRTADMKWATRLELALDNDRFELCAQLLSDLSNNSTALHLEVLLRMRADNGALVSPAMFLPAAERFHMATRIDRWVLEHGIEKLLALPDPSRISTMYINLSGQSIGDIVFHRDAIELLKNAGPIACERICVEITETAVITNMADATIFIDQLHDLGIKVALDDFGAGASSFSYLKSLNVDTLKIDGQFIESMLHDPLNAAAVRCFIDVANVQGLRTVAEYVSSTEVLQHVKEMGIDFAQGFLLHKPQPIDQVLACRVNQPEMMANC